ncbi:MAG: adenosylcobinamide-GDP ribazoletransferase [Proteobacteria bacterium]|nr:adenosylcobinamide-GDP ribazoletransferase [Desulfobulbaceae bacterium]MBU4154257.1 adenosylcobinamide-GDP ribazoletransferase [Pseudomonadota bacterium]MDP2106482.1 adenosylcobinamide-GDP ribazoletransferase [Desulfobulbaceae bacterium]
MIARFCAALRFLTVLPVPGHLGTEEQHLARSLVFFPVVGVVIGCIMAVIAWLIWPFLPALPAAAVMVFLMLAISGGFHLDGLADSADGMLSARPREQILTIMRDSQIGSMGAAALVMVLLAKTVALGSLPQVQAASAVFLMPIAGRCLMVLMMAFLPYVRGEEGRAALFYQAASQEKKIVYITGGVLYSSSWYACGGSGLAAGAIALVAMLLFAWLCRVKIGGATGDTLGATCELTEMVIVLILSAGW